VSSKQADFKSYDPEEYRRSSQQRETSMQRQQSAPRNADPTQYETSSRRAYRAFDAGVYRRAATPSGSTQQVGPRRVGADHYVSSKQSDYLAWDPQAYRNALAPHRPSSAPASQGRSARS
jgi:hypothetical protein